MLSSLPYAFSGLARDAAGGREGEGGLLLTLQGLAGGHPQLLATTKIFLVGDSENCLRRVDQLVRQKRPKRQKPLVIQPLVAFVASVAGQTNLIRELALLEGPVLR